ncbi:Chromosome (plasmid) partitioning protein ParA [Rhodovulum sp. PH10]|uniref:ParA family protein n=1 Tax=Rhodovulum sp. PH10 TaxID=1187851 RepID=UPI00027C207D|nr:ParA family protein [Rhodovulum sp. PH10]EJW10867.1 Chromosome (plasmid) partitioning protein ParA [Rhodovulum sp. PH10]
MSLVVSVSNRKGGSGKTTTAVNLAAEWAARGLRTLVVDLDTQGHAGYGFGVVAGRGDPTVHDLFGAHGGELAAAIRPTAWQNLFVAPADPMFEGVSAGADKTLLARQLRASPIAEAFDRIVLDTPPAADAILVNALAAADAVLVPIVPHTLSAIGVEQLSRLLFRVATGVDQRRRLLGIVPVMTNGRINLHRTVVDEVTTRFGRDRLMKAIRSDIRVAEAFASRKPVRDYAPRSHGALDYHLLVEDLATLWDWPATGCADCAPAQRPRIS